MQYYWVKTCVVLQHQLLALRDERKSILQKRRGLPSLGCGWGWGFPLCVASILVDFAQIDGADWVKE